MRSWRIELERVSQDLRYGLRTLRHAPVFSAIAVACLALGIGGNAAVLSWTEGIVHHPFPGVRDQDQLVAVVGTLKGGSFGGLDEMSYPDFTDLSRGTTAFSAFFVSKITGATITGTDRAERAVGQLVTANYFDAIGVRPTLGRGFLPGEDVGRGAHPIVVISHRLWKERYGGTRSIIGSTISFDGVPHTIIGVAPQDFLGTFVGYDMQFWVPASQQAVFDPSGYKLEDRSVHWVEGFARLKPGVTLAAGQAQVDAAARRLAAEFPNSDRGRGVRILPLEQNPFDNAKVLKPILRIGSLVGLVVLLIVCANIANLLLVRSLARRSEFIVRRALGASPGRLTRQLVTEALILAVSGTALGLALAYLGRDALGLFFAPRGGAPLIFAADFNASVILTSIAIGLGSTLLFSLAPIIHTRGLDLAAGMRSAAPGAIGGTRRLLRSLLVVVQVSFGVLLLIASGLVLRSLDRMLKADPGFSTDPVLTTTVNLFDAGYDSARAHRYEDDLLLRARAISGVTAAAFSRAMPFSTRPYDNGPIFADGYQAARDEQPTADYNTVTPGYFMTTGIPLVSGRDFSAADADTTAPVAIVSRAMAERYWPNASPIGKRLRLRNTWMQIVGVVGDIKYSSLRQADGMLFYVPFAQQRASVAVLYLRTTGASAASIAPAVLRTMHAIDPNVSPYEFVTMREVVNRSASGQRITVSLLGIFGAVALILACIGLYGVIAYMVSQSTRELGLRMALGATPGGVRALVLSSGMRLAVIGIAIGATIALSTTWLLGTLLFGIGPRDPLVFCAVIAVMVATSVGACAMPAWRASRVDPVRALKA